MVSAETLAAVNVRAIELYMYIDKKGQRPAFNYLELNQINYLDIRYIWFIDSLKCFYFRSILFSIAHNDTMECSFLSNNCLLSNHYYQITKTRFAVQVVKILYESIPLTEILSCLKVAKKYMHVYYFDGKNFTCWDLRGMLETDSFEQKDSE